LRGPAAAPPPDVLEAVNVARRLGKESKGDDALSGLQDVAPRHPRSIEVRRALRTAARERERRLKPREPESLDFPELDATYQGSPTRRTPDTVMQPGPEAPETAHP